MPRLPLERALPCACLLIQILGSMSLCAAEVGRIVSLSRDDPEVCEVSLGKEHGLREGDVLLVYPPKAMAYAARQDEAVSVGQLTIVTIFDRRSTARGTLLYKDYLVVKCRDAHVARDRRPSAPDALGPTRQPTSPNRKTTKASRPLRADVTKPEGRKTDTEPQGQTTPHIPDAAFQSPRTWRSGLPAGESLFGRYLSYHDGTVRISEQNTGTVRAFHWLQLSGDDRAFVQCEMRPVRPWTDKEGKQLLVGRLYRHLSGNVEIRRLTTDHELLFNSSQTTDARIGLRFLCDEDLRYILAEIRSDIKRLWDIIPSTPDPNILTAHTIPITHHWSDVSEQFSTDAFPVGYTDEAINLINLEGREVAVPVSRLSPEGRSFAKRLVAAATGKQKFVNVDAFLASTAPTFVTWSFKDILHQWKALAETQKSPSTPPPKAEFETTQQYEARIAEAKRIANELKQKTGDTLLGIPPKIPFWIVDMKPELPLYNADFGAFPWISVGHELFWNHRASLCAGGDKPWPQQHAGMVTRIVSDSGCSFSLHWLTTDIDCAKKMRERSSSLRAALLLSFVGSKNTDPTDSSRPVPLFAPLHLIVYDGGEGEARGYVYSSCSLRSSELREPPATFNLRDPIPALEFYADQNAKLNDERIAQEIGMLKNLYSLPTTWLADSVCSPDPPKQLSAPLALSEGVRQKALRDHLYTLPVAARSQEYDFRAEPQHLQGALLEITDDHVKFRAKGAAVESTRNLQDAREQRTTDVIVSLDEIVLLQEFFGLGPNVVSLRKDWLNPDLWSRSPGSNWQTLHSISHQALCETTPLVCHVSIVNQYSYSKGKLAIVTSPAQLGEEALPFFIDGYRTKYSQQVDAFGRAVKFIINFASGAKKLDERARLLHEAEFYTRCTDLLEIRSDPRSIRQTGNKVVVSGEVVSRRKVPASVWVTASLSADGQGKQRALQYELVELPAVGQVAFNIECDFGSMPGVSFKDIQLRLLTYRQLVDEIYPVDEALRDIRDSPVGNAVRKRVSDFLDKKLAP